MSLPLINFSIFLCPGHSYYKPPCPTRLIIIDESSQSRQTFWNNILAGDILLHAWHSRTHEAALFQNIFNCFTFLPKFPNILFLFTFLLLFWKIARMPLLSRIGPDLRWLFCNLAKGATRLQCILFDKFV